VIEKEALDRRAAEVCRCRHERAFHDPCSRCFCAWFLPRAEKDKLLVNAWANELARREAKESGPVPVPDAAIPDPNDGLSIPEIARRLRKAGK